MVMPKPKLKHKLFSYFKQFAIPIIVIEGSRPIGEIHHFKTWFLFNNLRYYFQCTNCSKPITKKEVKQFDSQCKDCWYECQQERTLNEEVER
jgi:hypothetical protein